MEKANIVSIVPTKVGDTRLKQIMILVSSICLVTVLYLNGTFSHIAFTPSPEPSNGPQIASSGSTNRTTATTSVSDVTTKALAFYAMLTTAQQATLEQTYTTTLARNWSNLPCGASCRNGLEFGDLTSAQLAAAMEVVQAALGTTYNNGYDEWNKIRLADAYLGENGGGGGYDSTLRWICFLNAPSTTGAWMLQFGGHHYAANIAFNSGHVIGATPYFMGVEPSAFPWGDSVYAPLSDERTAFITMLASLTTSELATANLSTTFSDCVMIPGETNGGPTTFPAKAGVLCSTLTTAQKNLVLAVISQNYVMDMDSVTAASIIATYASQLDSTYISYTGSGTSGDTASFLNAVSNYVRIDGPQVWIELECQAGIVFPCCIHYHTVWRDHVHDYGQDLSGSPIDTSGGTTGIVKLAMYNTISIYPNPASDKVSVSFNSQVTNARILLTNAMGQTSTLATHYNGTTFSYDVSKLPSGMYVLKVIDNNATFTGKFTKL